MTCVTPRETQTSQPVVAPANPSRSTGLSGREQVCLALFHRVRFRLEIFVEWDFEEEELVAVGIAKFVEV